MFFRAKRAINRSWFDLNCRHILKTPRLPPSDAKVSVVTMLGHGEVRMYLLALKSFVHQLGRSPKVVILNDGSLDGDDLATLHAHVATLSVVPITSISTGGCPKGSCWERLLLISDLVQDGYIVQLDSDTLTVKAIPEVVACIDANRSFTLLGDRSYPQVEPMLEACARSKSNVHTMVQAVCERAFDQLPESSELKYLRGNAGFVGFAQGSIQRERIEWFSELMRRLAREKWDEWGSEQVTSNLLIANAENPLPLPALRYLSYWTHPEIPYDEAAFVHFIGPHRYSNGFYLRTAKQVLATLH